MERLTMAQETLWSDLKQRTLDAMFDAQFPENGSFVSREMRGRTYLYYVGYRGTSGGETASKQFSKYVGPASDPAVVKAAAEFKRLKAGYKERRDLVRALRSLNFPGPPAIVGDIVEALWKAGVFRLRGILVGTAAFQTYAGTMGVRFPQAPTMTGDVDIAQFRSVSMAVEDTTAPILPALQQVDPSFSAVAHQTSKTRSFAFHNDKDFRVEFLAPHVGGADHARELFLMPAMSDASAQPLRFLDFLIHKPERTVLLHRGGIPVTVPSPERYCIHKLIVSQRRIKTSEDKARKDLYQSNLLLEAAALTGVLVDFGHVWLEAWQRGPKWREALNSAERRLDDKPRAHLADARRQACAEAGLGPDRLPS